jgi:hypothetical protein
MLFVLAPAASADLIQIFANSDGSTKGLGDFTGSLEYSFDAPSEIGHLTVSITNTSPAFNGGYITGFLFNIASTDDGAFAVLQPGGTHPFEDLTGGGLNGEPFGHFEGGAALGGNWQGGGPPFAGIAVGQTGVFDFNVFAADAAVLTAMSFIEGPTDFLVRLRGFDNGGSDKVPAAVVPGPATLTALALALVAWPRRRRRGAAG